MQQLNTGYEIVHTVTDYYDGPRQGIADYKGMPHFYECIFDTVTDDYSDLYKLTPVDISVGHGKLGDLEKMGIRVSYRQSKP